MLIPLIAVSPQCTTQMRLLSWVSPSVIPPCPSSAAGSLALSIPTSSTVNNSFLASIVGSGGGQWTSAVDLWSAVDQLIKFDDRCHQQLCKLRCLDFCRYRQLQLERGSRCDHEHDTHHIKCPAGQLQSLHCQEERYLSQFLVRAGLVTYQAAGKGPSNSRILVR